MLFFTNRSLSASSASRLGTELSARSAAIAAADVAMLPSPSARLSSHDSSAFLTAPEVAQSAAADCTRPASRSRRADIAVAMPNAYSALSSNRELPQAGPMPLLSVQYALLG